MKTPFDEALEAASRLENPSVQSSLLGGLAKSQVESGLIDDALSTIGLIPNRSEKRSLLLHLALDALREKRTEQLFRFARDMIEIDSASSPAIGRMALSLLTANPNDGEFFSSSLATDASGSTRRAEARMTSRPCREDSRVETALALLELSATPFDSERSRYDFFDKLLESGGKKHFEAARRFLETFADPDYRDWAVLACSKRLAEWGRRPEAEHFALSFSSPLRRSWALFEMSRPVPDLKKFELQNRAGEILEAVSIDAENAESLAIQLRILGKAAWKAGNADLAERLLERSEAAADSIAVPVRRFRARLFLAKVVRETGRIAGPDDYLDRNAWLSASLSHLERSRLLQWSAEAVSGTSSDWTAAVQEAARKEEREVDESARAERIVEIVRRFAVRHREAVPSNDPSLDAVILAGEEFEEHYYNPFSVGGCDCHDPA